MPETHFTIRWPDGSVEDCYSPSTIILSHLELGRDYPLPDFMRRAEVALEEASERVRARYGFACSSALDQYRTLRAKADELTPRAIDGPVSVLALGAPPEHFSVVVIGAGQAGLSMSHLLAEQGIDHVVLERHEIAHSWRSERWDSFCLVTPNWQCKLPGYEYEGDDPHGFMKRDAIVEFIEEYAARFDPPVRTGVSVKRVSREGEGFGLETSRGYLRADQVVVATGGYHRPKVPGFAAQLPVDVEQIHSRDYKSPEQLPAGAVLVVGSGQSGCQIAEDLLLAGRSVHLSVGDAPRVARRYRGRDVVDWLDDMGHYDIPIDQMPDPETARRKTNHYVTGRNGGHDIDLRAFALQGLRLHGTTADYREGRLTFLPNLQASLDAADDTYRRINASIDEHIAARGIDAPEEPPYVPCWFPETESPPLDLQAAGITSIIWSIGFAADYGWLDFDLFDEAGAPRHDRGVTEEPGLYFLGLPWLHTWGSGRFCGVAKDAAYLAERIVVAAREPKRAQVRPAVG